MLLQKIHSYRDNLVLLPRAPVIISQYITFFFLVNLILFTKSHLWCNSEPFLLDSKSNYLKYFKVAKTSKYLYLSFKQIGDHPHKFDFLQTSLNVNNMEVMGFKTLAIRWSTPWIVEFHTAECNEKTPHVWNHVFCHNCAWTQAWVH